MKLPQAETLLRALSLAFAAFALAWAGQISTPLSPWSALALPAGLALAAHNRWSAVVYLPVATGTALALMLSGAQANWAMLGTAVVVGAPWLAQTALHRMDFDPRLARGSDLAALTGAVVLAAALPAALVLASWIASSSVKPPLQDLATGWCVISLCMLCTAIAAMAIEHESQYDWQGGADAWRATLAGAVAVLVMLWALWLAPSVQSPLAPLAVFLPGLVLTALVLNGHLALGASGLLMATLLTAGTAKHGLSLWGGGGNVAAALMAWMGSSLALILVARANTAEWQGRNQRWEWALDGSRLGVADWHLLRQDSFASAAWRSLTEHTPLRWDPLHWQASLLPEDRHLLLEALAALGTGQTGRRKLELRHPHNNGWRWMELTLMVIERDAKGQPLRLMATLSDVHERRQAQEQQMMSVSLFQHLHEGLLITDNDMRVIDSNPAFTDMLGISREEALGTVPALLHPSPIDPVERQQRAALWAGLRDHGMWRGEMLTTRKSGELCTLQVTISTVMGPNNTARYHVVVLADITQQQAQRERLERQALFDELTRLPNRTHLSHLLQGAISAADRDGYLLLVCYLDLDHFKPVNDRYGHAAGDRLLAELAGRLRSALRKREDWTDSAARLGGDEFVLLLRAGTMDEARLAVERVLRVVAQPYVVEVGQEPVQVMASMGATVYPLDHSDADALLRHADHAMYSAKQAGRNGYLFFDPEHRRRTEERAVAIGRVQEALDRQEFVLYYQPKVDMRTARVMGFEALIRWEHPEHGLIAPMQFLPLIENTGLSSRVGDWALAQALDHLAQWRRDGFDFSVSVNISARHLQETDFALRLTELLARRETPLAAHLELEMLETAAHADIDVTSALLARCRRLGVRFALDDFGTGYSTLTYLKRLPVDVLKIDRSFVHNMLDDEQDKAIVEGVIGLARTFGCVVVAEGVESPAQARTLLDMGCTLGQGTGIAAPMPSFLVAQWVRDYKGIFTLAPTDAAALPPALARVAPPA